MLNVALVEPEIPQNTGNIARLCAATMTPLHIVGVTGFRLDDRAVRRAGLDYWDEVALGRHRSRSHHHNNNYQPAERSRPCLVRLLQTLFLPAHRFGNQAL